MVVAVAAPVGAAVVVPPRSLHRLSRPHHLLPLPALGAVEGLGQPGLRPCHAPQAVLEHEHVCVRGHVLGHVHGHVWRQRLPHERLPRTRT